MTNCIAQKTNDTMLNIHYKAITRGSSKTLTVLNDTLEYVFNQEKKSVVLSVENQKEILDLINAIELTKMNSFQSPSSKRASDRALHATLKIEKENKEYTSTTFDHGNPPTALKPLMDLLMSFVAE